ncbi:hypothetical protein FBU31_005987, partial [Coemansia sp. 'formosensis']
MSAHFDFNSLLSRVNVGDAKETVVATLSEYSPVVEDKQITIKCPRSTSNYLYVT